VALANKITNVNTLNQISYYQSWIIGVNLWHPIIIIGKTSVTRKIEMWAPVV